MYCFGTNILLLWIKQKGTYYWDNLTEYKINLFKLMFSGTKFFITDNDCIELSQKTLVLTQNVHEKAH